MFPQRVDILTSSEEGLGEGVAVLCVSEWSSGVTVTATGGKRPYLWLWERCLVEVRLRVEGILSWISFISSSRSEMITVVRCFNIVCALMIGGMIPVGFHIHTLILLSTTATPTTRSEKTFVVEG